MKRGTKQRKPQAVGRSAPTSCSAFFCDPFTRIAAGLDIQKEEEFATFIATSYRKPIPRVPKKGEYFTGDGLRVKIDSVETNQDKSGRWPDNEWPRITIHGHYKPNAQQQGRRSRTLPAVVGGLDHEGGEQ